MRLAGVDQRKKNIMTSLGIEPVTVRHAVLETTRETKYISDY
jgi:hypothetical protein